MKKPSKLVEKPVRFPETRAVHWQEVISQYLEDCQKQQSEQARATRFAMLLTEMFRDQPAVIASYADGIEQFLQARQTGGALRGRTDNLFGNLIIEFEAAIPAKREEAEEQIRRYAAIQWSEEKPQARTRYLGVATDGVRFISFTPICAEPHATEITPGMVRLETLEEVDWTKQEAGEIYFWLDRTLVRQEVLHPTSNLIVADFGIQSHAFQTAKHRMLDLWDRVRDENAFSVVFDSWEKYLLIVYGSKVSSDELFVRHTYLATLAKLMSWQRLTENSEVPTTEEIVEMLQGELFKKRGIENFIEEDFFSWLARGEARPVAVDLVRGLSSLLRSYNLRELSEDVFKALYQELVDPETRHDLGEYYTPDWLAHRVVNRLLDSNPRGSLLDPACGSGTFLYLAIREKKEHLERSVDTTRHILESVCGADIHPLAVIVAKTNYILALGDLLTSYRPRGAITIPVYLADTLRLPVPFLGGNEYPIPIEKRLFHIHESLVEQPAFADHAIELQNEFAQKHKGQRMDREAFRRFLQSRRLTPDDEIIDSLFEGAKQLKELIEGDRDSIWAYVIKNIYKPLFFKGRFDFIAGNPPWIALRFMEPEYQAFLKEQTTGAYALLSGRGHLVTQMEIASLFLIRAADLYLKSGGCIGFVLPKSFFSADQHDGLRRRAFHMTNATHTLQWREMWDCEKVRPLFAVPACVLVADKVPAAEALPATAPISGCVLSGRLKNRNEPLTKAEAALQAEEVVYRLHERGKRSYWDVGETSAPRQASPYKSRFVQGATLVPRSFWFVQLQSSQHGFDRDRPPLQTDDRARAEAKEPYKDVFFKGNIESDFLFATLLSTDLLPFGHLPFRLVALPISSEGTSYKMLPANVLRGQGALDFAEWVERAEEEWRTRRGEKSGRATLIEWLNWSNKLMKQNPTVPFRVLYGRSGTYLTATVAESSQVAFQLGDQSVNASGYVVDSTLHHAEFKSRIEAFYVATVLNSPVIDESIKPMQTRGLFGPRDIYKKVLDLPIPEFSGKDETHSRLAKLGEECAAKVSEWLAQGGAGAKASIGRARSQVRQMLAEELREIDEAVRGILE